MRRAAARALGWALSHVGRGGAAASAGAALASPPADADFTADVVAAYAAAAPTLAPLLAGLLADADADVRRAAVLGVKRYARHAHADAAGRAPALLGPLALIGAKEKANFPTQHALDRCLVHLLRTAAKDAPQTLARVLAGIDADTAAAITDHARRLGRQPAESDDDEEERD